MYYFKFREIYFAYCKEYRIPTTGSSFRKNLHREYNATKPNPDDDVSVAKFLDTKELMNNCKQPFPVSIFDACVNIPVRASTTTCCEAIPYEKQEGKTQMNTNTERDYLARRVECVSYDLDSKLEKQFNLGKNTNPRTYKDLIDWVTNGKYTLDTKITGKIDAIVADDETYYGSSFDGIVWTGAGFTVDHAGYVIARKAMQAARTVARDVVMTQDATAGLAALNAFEAWTYTAPAVTPVA